MNKLIAASAALLIAMAPTFAMAQEADPAAVDPVQEDVILIGPEATDATAIAAGVAGVLAIGLLLGGGGGSSTTTTTTTTTTTAGN